MFFEDPKKGKICIELTLTSGCREINQEPRQSRVGDNNDKK